MKGSAKKIIVAAGGTGGHLFPAQAVAEKIEREMPGAEIFFAGASLSQSAYFDKLKFAHKDITSTTPFRGSIFKAFKSVATLIRGIRESMKLLSEKKPDIVVGFGSFHAFPVLCAAALKRIPIALFEANSIPGKVVRLFSKGALFTAIYFPDAKRHLKGKTHEVEIPIRKQRNRLPAKEARHLFRLEEERLTFLVFGGSQGAKRINQHILELLGPLSEKLSFQLIHFTGNKEMTDAVTQKCRELNIPCYVKEFEPQMDVAWSAADVVVCRSGASTASELLHYEVPGLLIPYPFAADQHQLANALYLEKTVGGAVHLPDHDLSVEGLLKNTLGLAQAAQRLEMKQAIVKYKAEQKKGDLSSLILEFLCQK